MHRSLIVLTCIALGGIALCALVYTRVGNPFDPFDDERFTPSAWSAADAQRRALMARDLIAHHLSTGMTQAHVIAVLGSCGGPSQPWPGRPYPPGTKFCYVYNLEMPRSLFAGDDAMLQLYFDTSERLISAEIISF